MSLNHFLLRMDKADAPVFTKAASAVFALAVGLFVTTRLWHLTAYSLWIDEIFSLQIARLDWGGLMAHVVEDIFHPPLFFLLLKLWIAIGGESLLWLKLFPVLTSFAAIIPFFLLCRELKLRAAEINLALVLMAVNAYLSYYAQELRMYSLVVFFTVCSLWLFFRFFNCEVGNRKHLVALFAVNLLLVYTQYFGWLVVGVEFIFLLFWARRKLPAFTVSVAGLIVCFSPWAYAVAQATIRKEGLGRAVDWVRRPGWYSLLDYYATLNGLFDFRGSRSLGVLLFGSPILLWAWRVLRETQEEDEERIAAFWGLSLFSFLPVALTYAVNQILAHPIWHRRYVIIVAVPYMILLAIAVHRLRPKWVRTATILLVGGWATLAGFKEVSNVNLSRSNKHKVAWEALIHQMIQAGPPQENGIKVYAFGWMLAIPMQFYLEDAHETRFQVVAVDDSVNKISRNMINLPLLNYDKDSASWKHDKDSTELDGDHFWVTFYKNKREQVEGILMDRGYQVGTGFEGGHPNDRTVLAPVWRR